MPIQKKGTPERRTQVARAARKWRDKFRNRQLQGGWTRKQWNYQIRLMIVNALQPPRKAWSELLSLAGAAS